MSRPAELYRFVQGTTVWTYTSADAPIDYNGETYTAVPIGRGELEQSGEIARAGLSVSVARDNPVGAQFLAYAPDALTTLTVYRQEGATTAVLWKGRVMAAKANGSEIELTCESVFTSLRRQGLRARYQRPCRHALYGRGCRLNQASFADAGLLLSAVAGVTLTVPDADAQPDGWYFGGMAESPGGVLRFVVGHTGATITLAQPIEGLVSVGYGESYGTHYGGEVITLYPGCDRTRETCEIKFNNLVNYGGWPFMPTRNPFDSNSIV